MKERPILFSAPMIRALLAGTKTQTRRIVKLPPQPSHHGGWEPTVIGGDCCFLANGAPAPECAGIWNRTTGMVIACTYGDRSDRLWVRETHARFSVGEGMDRPTPECIAYRATCGDDGCFDYVNGRGEITNLQVTKWTPSIFMPRWASRITLAITNVRAERLHSITEADCWAEGLEKVDGELDDSAIGRAAHFMACSQEDARATYGALWAEINGEASLIANPWVWVVEFERVAEAA